MVSMLDIFVDGSRQINYPINACSRPGSSTKISGNKTQSLVDLPPSIRYSMRVTSGEDRLELENGQHKVTPGLGQK